MSEERRKTFDPLWILVIGSPEREAYYMGLKQNYQRRIEELQIRVFLLEVESAYQANP